MAKILEVKYAHLADASVCEVPEQRNADLCWHEAAYESQATGDASWFFVHYANRASFKVFRVKHGNQADLKIFKVTQAELAGWRNTDHPLRGRLG